MPIHLTAIKDGTLFHGYTWKIADENELARLVALVALGQSRHVLKILAAVSGVEAVPGDDAKVAAKGMLHVAPGTEPWHRDGWLFQVMSWLAATKANPSSLIAAPQMIKAQKGFDGLQLDIDSHANSISAVIIFEDKATEDPRGTIHDQVWPDFQLLEGGDRANVLVAEVTSLLEKSSVIDTDDAISKIIWKDVRHYRVSITVQDTHSTPAGRKRLFKDYDSTIVGNVKRRRGETFHVQDLRPWMSDLAHEAINYIDSLKSANV